MRPIRTIVLPGMLAVLAVAIGWGLLAGRDSSSERTSEPVSAPDRVPTKSPEEEPEFEHDESAVAVPPAAPAGPRDGPPTAWQLEKVVSFRSVGSFAEAVRLLALALRDRDPNRRRRAAVSLWALGPEAAAAMPALVEALGTSDRDVLAWVLSALVDGCPAPLEAAPALRAIIEGNREPRLVAQAIRALLRIGLPEDEVRTALDHADLSSPSIAFAVAEARWSLDGNADAALAIFAGALSSGALPGSWEEALPAWVVTALERSPGCGPEIVARLESALADPGRRAHALLALAELGSLALSAAEAVEPHLTGIPPAWRVPAAWALWRLTGDTTRTLPVLRDGLRKRGRGGVLAAQCLGRMGPAAAVALADLTPFVEARPPSPLLQGSYDFHRLVRSAEAVYRITGERERALATLEWTLIPEYPDFATLAARVLAGMGRDAETALPALRAVERKTSSYGLYRAVRQAIRDIVAASDAR